MATVEDICNRSLDSIGADDQIIGDIQQGTRAARVLLRHYIPCLEQLLRGAYWNFSRRCVPMTLLGAVPGFGPAVPAGDTPPYGSQVIIPWVFEYALPIDCVAARFVPWNNSLPQSATPSNNISVPPVPPTTVNLPFQSPPIIQPARMLVANDINYPLPISPETPPQQWWNTRGAAPDQRTVVLCNVPNAELVYTAFIPYPNLWDPLFQEAMVALLATYLALPCNPDKKEGRALRAEQISIAKRALDVARVRDGDENATTIEHIPDWIRARNTGAGYAGWGGFGGYGGPGVFGYSWGGVCFGDGSVY
jgi:hypothetical protein